jgi:PAS domain S-box-containing protein
LSRRQIRKPAEQPPGPCPDFVGALVQSAGEAILLIDFDGKVLFANCTATERMGMAAYPLAGRSVLELFPPEIGARHLANIQETIRNGQGAEHESWTVIGGQRRWYRTSIRPVRDAAGTVTSAMVLARDATEQKLSSERLERSESLYHSIFDALPDATHVVDAEMRVVLMNEAFRRWSRDIGIHGEPVGRRLLEWFPFLTRAVAAEYRQVFRTGRPLVANDLSAVGGRAFHTETHKVPLLRDGKVERIVTIVRDVTEKRHTEDALRAAHAKLMTAREEERRHLAAELHDSIGQHLVALKLAIENSKPQGQGLASDELRTALGGVTAYCNDIIREVRGICQGLYPPALESLGLAAALRQLAGYCRNGSVALRVRCGRGLANARFGPDLEIALYRIAQEAVNNALRHGQARRIVIVLGCRRRQLWMRVRDDGRGFGVAAVGNGGLGLTTMRQRAQAVDGTFEVRSQPGSTCVEVRVACRDGCPPLARSAKD